MSDIRKFSIMNGGITINGDSLVTLAIEEKGNQTFNGDSAIRVIEHSAYQALERKLKIAVGALRKVSLYEACEDDWTEEMIGMYDIARQAIKQIKGEK